MIELKNVTKTFMTTDTNQPVDAVHNVSFQVEKGEIFGIVGASGAGKSTLVRCINLLEKPTAGEVIFEGTSLGKIDHKELLKQRQSISMIFQNFNLFSQRTVLRNVCYPLEISGIKRVDAEKKAHKLLSLVGLSEKANAYVTQLSGGQKQRVAIARALATDPKVLLCDEATSALDPNTTASILSLLKEVNTNLGVTIIIITHEMDVVQRICDKVAVMNQGTIVESGRVEDVFLNPQSDITRSMLGMKQSLKGVDSEGPIIRITFDGSAASQPVISQLVLACQAPVNILKANTEEINGKAYGQMVIQLPNQMTLIQKIKDFLTSESLAFEEEVDFYGSGHF